VLPRTGLVALQFLTRLPVRLDPAPQPRELGLSLRWYPAVGLLLGCILWAAALILRDAPPSIAGALVLVLWVLLTGGLHLDGLADTADAWVGAQGDRERALAIMKDTHAGAAAITTVTCVLILKFAALSAYCANPTGVSWSPHAMLRLAGILIPALLGRAAMPLLFATTPYVREGGIGAQAALNQSRAWNLILSCGAGVLCIMPGVRAAAVVALCAATFIIVRRGFMRLLGGFTGDCAGALIELTETVAIVALAIMRPFDRQP
jgi:adenosylcobinamide-GDP ribazoletransferase